MNTRNVKPVGLIAEASNIPVMAMLIDDQAMVGEAVRRLLAGQPNIALHYTPDPQDAIEQAVQIKPTVILLDLLMPNIDGLEMIRRFRARPETACVPIVVLSTTDDAAKKSEAFAAGADDYLVKLPDKVELIARIRYHSTSYQNLIQRNEAYRALRESQHNLLDSNTALTSLNQAYHQAKDDAERANQAKSDFLSRMSHELRTPLNAILGFSQILEMEELTQRQHESVGHIMNAGTHLLSLINEMLDIARIESGRIALSLEPILLSKVIDEAVELIRPLAGDLDITVSKSASDVFATYVHGDRQRLKQVLINLLSNAVKYNRPGGLLGITGEVEPDGQVRISITDTGNGISDADMQKLFMPFERLQAEETGVEGTGLGLALSKRLIEAMDGTLTANSTVGQGSSFDIRLPADTSQTAESEENAVADAPDLVEPRESSTKTVLLIEDNMSNVNLMEVVFAGRPDNILLTAMQGKVGIELAQRYRPDIILLDLNLPDIPGQEVLQLLREHEDTAGIPVIIVSADATPQQVERLMASGAAAYITKPVNIKEFLVTFNALLK